MKCCRLPQGRELEPDEFDEEEFDDGLIEDTKRSFDAAKRRPGARNGTFSTQQRLAGFAAGDGDDDGGGDDSGLVQAPPIMGEGILERVNFNLEELNAYLLARGTQDGDTPLHIAAQEGHVEVAYWLLMEGANCSAVNQFGDTPLHFAARWGHAEVARLLIKGGASLRAKNGMGWVPLHHAAAYSASEVATLLLDSGAEVAPMDMWGRCPIHFAASNDDFDIVSVLLKHGAHVDSLTVEGDTPLMYAAGYGHFDTVELLVRRRPSALIHTLWFLPLPSGRKAACPASSRCHRTAPEIPIARPLKWRPAHGVEPRRRLR